MFCKPGFVLSAMLIAATVVPAIAQNNSLFRGNRPRATPAQNRAASSQPVRPNAVVAGIQTAAVRPKPLPAPEEPPPNEVLLRNSAIAIEKPKVEKIKVHDLITIIIREDKQSSSDAQTKSEKDWQVDSEFKKWFRLNKDDHLVGQQFAAPTPGVEFDFQNEWEGKGKLSRRDSFTTRVTAEVIDVKPNGNLVIEARKVITNDDDTQTVTLTGTCRAVDVSPQNTILSTQIASLVVEAKHSGPARDASRRGWLMKAIDFLRPI